jgi:hypothetical protein
MSASLVEMVLAIAIAGLILTVAIIPTTETVVAYQKAEAELRQATSQATAVVRAEQVAASVWRDADPPENHATLQRAGTGWLQVGHWELRQQEDRLEQKQGPNAWTPIAEPVRALSFQYLLNDGSWTTSVSEAQFDEVLAVRFDWGDPVSGRQYGGLALAPDRAFSTGLIQLPQPDTSEPYHREDYEQTVTFSLGSWQ